MPILSSMALMLLAVPLLSAATAQSAPPPPDRASLPTAMGLTAGLWSSTIVLESVEIEPLPGRPPLSPEMDAAVRSRVGRSATNDDCIAAVTPGSDTLLIPGVRIGAGCPVEILEAAGGRLRYRALCDDGSGFVADASGEASYTATSIEGRHRLSARSPGAGYAVRATARVVSRHEGQCLPRAPRPG
jgi:hypothetical protein